MTRNCRIIEIFAISLAWTATAVEGQLHNATPTGQGSRLMPAEGETYVGFTWHKLWRNNGRREAQRLAKLVVRVTQVGRKCGQLSVAT